MVNSVLSTIDTELDEDFYESREGFSGRLFNFMRGLSLSLRELGVDFEVYRPSSILRGTEKRKLEERIADSDIVFHNKPAMIEVPNPRLWLVDTIDGVINDSYREKSHLFVSRDKYQMSKAMESAGVPIPATMTVEEYLDSTERLLPVVLKERNGTLGKGVYYIDRPGLVERFFKEGTYSKTPGRAPSRRRYFVQQFIHMPGLPFNHYRVFTVGGEILGCALTARRATKESADATRESKSLDEIFYRLRTYPIATNAAPGGGREIPVSHQSRIIAYREVLEAHGIDPENVAIPEPLKQHAQLVGRELRKYGFLYAGQDWIRDEQGFFYFLEANPFPNLWTFNALYFNGKGSRRDYTALAISKIAEAVQRCSP